MADPKSIAAIAPTAALRLLSDRVSWTDEQWAANDAQIAADRDREAFAPRATVNPSIAEVLAADGWPVRAVEAAGKLDETKGCIPQLRTWDADDRNVLVLSGQAGVGKTVGAAWWARQQPFSVLFVRASTFAASSRYDRAGERDRLLNARALVLDDLGAEYADAKGSLVVDLDELVDTYYGDKRPLIITTNSTLAQFVDRYGQRIASRLTESGRWIGLTGESLRRRA